MESIELEIFKNLFASVAEEMGATLGRSAYSPNIKERRDYSCAVFDATGRLVAQAAHIPVHLGAMPLSVAQSLRDFDTFAPGDVVLLNDPYRGGTHLPDLTLISPVFVGEELLGFVANRAHHADLGGSRPGSMGLAKEIVQEGLRIPPVKWYEAGRENVALRQLLLANVRTPEERLGDLAAQRAANHIGECRLREIVERYDLPTVRGYMHALQEYAERMARTALAFIPPGTYRFADLLDDDGVTEEPVEIRVAVAIAEGEATVDFTGTAAERPGCLNCVYAVTVAATYYAFACLWGPEVPVNAGCFAPLSIIAPPGTVVNATFPHAVAGGNVETAQRIVDVLFGALAQALPDRIPAASCGSMNNLLIGGYDPFRERPFTYYETIAGGLGARPDRDGISGVHTHMTNTLNTPIEALEFAYPLRVLRYEFREGSGGAGKYRGGDGLRRDIQVLCAAEATILSERRRTAPYGLRGGEPGQPGENALLTPEGERPLPSKVELTLQPGEVLSIRTPGGGGYGSPKKGLA
ncbi:MAG TPA: hydantoinase B/oxoprolinase family protein [Armatimonadetes bacterium]|nr:hydantoinase B/oxoprolinase family protein [Armatimonadota bacterium]